LPGHVAQQLLAVAVDTGVAGGGPVADGWLIQRANWILNRWYRWHRASDDQPTG